MRRGAERANSIVWVLLVGVVLVIVFFIWRHQPRPEPMPAPIAVATPEPATPVPAAPAPVVVKATPTPTPAPVAVATPKPEPTPLVLDMATVARIPALWPAQVALTAPKSFPLVINGRIAGEGKVPAGTLLRVLRVGAQAVEVEYQGQRQIVAVALTDLLPRAQAAFRAAGSVLPTPPPAVATTAPVTPSETPAATPRMAVAGSAKIGDRMQVEVVRQKRSRIEGGDFDDKKDRIVLKVKLTNPDPGISAENLKGEICVLAESILDRTVVQMLAKQEFTFSLPARGSHEFLTEEAVTAYDTTGARFGHRYEGWLLRVRDSAGNKVLEKSTSPTLLKNVEKVCAVPVGSDFDRTTIAAKPASR